MIKKLSLIFLLTGNLAGANELEGSWILDSLSCRSSQEPVDLSSLPEFEDQSSGYSLVVPGVPGTCGDKSPEDCIESMMNHLLIEMYGMDHNFNGAAIQGVLPSGPFETGTPSNVSIMDYRSDNTEITSSESLFVEKNLLIHGDEFRVDDFHDECSSSTLGHLALNDNIFISTLPRESFVDCDPLISRTLSKQSWLEIYAVEEAKFRVDSGKLIFIYNRSENTDLQCTEVWVKVPALS